MTTLHIIKIMLGVILIMLLTACGKGKEETPKDRAAAGARSPDAAPRAKDTGEETPAVSLCRAHAVPASQCFICDAALRDPGRLWCREHARYEDRCFECHPELRDAKRLYCNEHGLYEDECFLCHPELLKTEGSRGEGRFRGAAAELSAALFCNEHDVPEAQCGICQPVLADALAPGEGLKIRLPSADSEAKARIRAERPQQGPAQDAVTAVGELGHNLNRLVHITPFSGGIVRRVHVDLGQDVARGDVLAELSSPKIAESKALFLKAVAEERVAAQGLARERELFENRVSSAQDLYDAEARQTAARAALEAARQTLGDLGFDRSALERIVEKQDAVSTLRLAAPFGGTVIARDAVVGDVVDVGKRLFSVADLGTLWLRLAVSASDVVKLETGQHVEIRSDALEGPVTGRITWVSSQLNPATRMAEVRAEVPNPDRVLRTGMYVNARIALGDRAPSVLVPRDAIHRFGGKPFVFVRLLADLYELRRVETGPEVRGFVALTAGVTGEELVATERSYLVKSEFQKSRLGAGCVD